MLRSCEERSSIIETKSAKIRKTISRSLQSAIPRIMIEMFKLGYNRYDPKATKGMFEWNNRDTRTNDKKVITKKANFELWKNFFTIRSATDWNMLQGEVIDSKTFNAFKNNLDKYWKKSGINKFIRINRKGVHHELIDRGDKTPKRSEKQLN